MYKVIWEYNVKPEMQETFLKLYGPEGEWVKLFRRSEHYRGTELLKKSGSGNTYITIDVWDSQKEYETFLSEHKEGYDVIDRIGDGLSESENKIGTYTNI